MVPQSLDLRQRFDKSREESAVTQASVRSEINLVCSKVLEIAESAVSERTHANLAQVIAQLTTWDANLLRLEVKLRSGKPTTDLRQALSLLEKAFKLIRHAREDTTLIAQLTMNEANNAT